MFCIPIFLTIQIHIPSIGVSQGHSSPMSLSTVVPGCKSHNLRQIIVRGVLRKNDYVYKILWFILPYFKWFQISKRYNHPFENCNNNTTFWIITLNISNSRDSQQINTLRHKIGLQTVELDEDVAALLSYICLVSCKHRKLSCLNVYFTKNTAFTSLIPKKHFQADS